MKNILQFIFEDEAAGVFFSFISSKIHQFSIVTEVVYTVESILITFHSHSVEAVSVKIVATPDDLITAHFFNYGYMVPCSRKFLLYSIKVYGAI
jgi:hypothetical protein